MNGAVETTRSKSGALKMTLHTEDGLTWEAKQSPLTQQVSIPGQYLHIRGPLEHKRPQKAMYDLHYGMQVDWPDNCRDVRRRERFNRAAWRLIDEAEKTATVGVPR